MIFLLLLIPFSSCNHLTRCDHPKICLIKENKILVEKRIIDDNKRTTNVVTYDPQTKMPIDSVVLKYNNKKVVDVKSYSFNVNHYEPDQLRDVDDYYFEVYGRSSNCPLEKQINQDFLIEDVVNNICSIQNSVLVTGKQISSLAVTTSLNEETEIRFPHINSKLNTLPEVFQSYFFNDILKSFTLVIKHGLLDEEKYKFSDGTFTRYFVYESRILKKEIIKIVYNDGRVFSSTRIYTLK